MESTGMVLGVEGKSIPTSRGQSTIYEIKFSDGRTWTTFEHKDASAAQAACQGKYAVTITGEEVPSKNGNFKNYRMSKTGGIRTAESNGHSQIPTELLAPATAPEPINIQRGFSDQEKQRLIVRQNVLRTAVESLAWSDEDFSKALERAAALERVVFGEGEPKTARSVAETLNKELAAIGVPPVAVGVDKPVPEWTQ